MEDQFKKQFEEDLKNNQENKEALESIKAEAEDFGYEEVVEKANEMIAKLEETADSLESSAHASDEQIESLGGNPDDVAEDVKEVQEEAEKVVKEAEEEIRTETEGAVGENEKEITDESGEQNPNGKETITTDEKIPFSDLPLMYKTITGEEKYAKLDPETVKRRLDITHEEYYMNGFGSLEDHRRELSKDIIDELETKPPYINDDISVELHRTAALRQKSILLKKLMEDLHAGERDRKNDFFKTFTRINEEREKISEEISRPIRISPDLRSPKQHIKELTFKRDTLATEIMSQEFPEYARLPIINDLSREPNYNKLLDEYKILEGNQKKKLEKAIEDVKDAAYEKGVAAHEVYDKLKDLTTEEREEINSSNTKDSITFYSPHDAALNAISNYKISGDYDKIKQLASDLENQHYGYTKITKEAYEAIGDSEALSRLSERHLNAGDVYLARKTYEAARKVDPTFKNEKLLNDILNAESKYLWE